MKIILKVILMAMCLFVAAFFAFGFWPHLSLKSPANSRAFYSCTFFMVSWGSNALG